MNKSVGNASDATAIRSAIPEDVNAIGILLEQYTALGNVLPRTNEEILRHIDDFYVIEAQSQVIGCGALEVFTDELVEIRSLMIAKNHSRQGYGRLLVEHLINETQIRGFRRLFALTYVPEYFHKLGFETVSKDTFPEKVWGICVKCYKFNRCDEIAVHRYLQK